MIPNLIWNMVISYTIRKPIGPLTLHSRRIPADAIDLQVHQSSSYSAIPNLNSH